MPHKDCAEIGIASIRRDLPTGTSLEQVEAVVDELNADPTCTGFLVQQPTGLDEFALLSRVDPGKDVDGLHPFNLGCSSSAAAAPLPCTRVGIIELLRVMTSHRGPDVVVVGRGLTVGPPARPAADRRSGNATVTLCRTGTRDLRSTSRRRHRRGAAGVPASSGPTWSKPGAAVVDVGVSRGTDEGRSRVVGRRPRPDVADVAGWVAPNPGGVGPLTRAMLLTERR